MRYLQPFLAIAYSNDEDSQRKHSDKVWRASERLRRAAGKVLDSLSTSKSTGAMKHLRESLKTVCQGIAEAFTTTVSKVHFRMI